MKKHKWNIAGLFEYYCPICGEGDHVHNTFMGKIGMVKEHKRIQNRTDCDKLFVKRKVVPRLLGI